MSSVEKLKIEDSKIEQAIKPWVTKHMHGICDGGRYKIFTKENAEKLVQWHYDALGMSMPKLFIAENLQEMYMIAKKFSDVATFTDLLEAKTKPRLQSKMEQALFVHVGIKEVKTFFLNSQHVMHPILSTNLYEVMRTQISELSKDFVKLVTTAGWNIGMFLAWLKSMKENFQIKSVPDEIDAFEEMYLASGVYATVFSKDAVVVCKYPKKVSFNEENRLHCVTGPAVEWGNNPKYPPFECYYINGRKMEKRIFDLIENNLLTKEMFVTEQDEEARAGMYEIMEGKGEGKMLEFLGATLIDSQKIVHPNGDIEDIFLYKTKESFPGETDLNGIRNVPLAWFKCICPSTGQGYFIPSDSSFNDALEAAKYHRDEDIPTDMDYGFHFRG